MSRTELRLVRDPPHRPLTSADLDRIAAEGKEWRDAFAPIKEAMERITGDDLRIRVLAAIPPTPDKEPGR